MFRILLFLIAFSFFSCKKDALPKPSGFLSLDYPDPKYINFDKNCAYSFDINNATIVTEESNCNFEINYPKMKATLYLSYKPVNNNIKLLLKDAQKLTYEHVIKADDIIEQPFINANKKVYGMFYSVNGNAATNAQFYVTDSTKHFLRGSLYFDAAPNQDSLAPVVNFLREDVLHLINTLEWEK